jgi:LuxR family maltose regulon positive regulatory protein
VYGAPRLPPHVIRRDRLMQNLDPSVPITVVRAPGGSGKTVLLAQWASGLRSDGIWVTLDDEAAARQSLWRTVAERMCDAGLVRPGTVLDGLAHSLEVARKPRPLLVRAFSQLTSPLMIVLDDYHHVTDPAIDEDVMELVTRCPRLAFVVSTRTVGPLESPLVAVAVDRRVLTHEEVVFSLEETTRLLVEAGVGDETDAEQVHGACGGSPFLLRTLLMQWASDRDRSAGSTTPDRVTGAVLLQLLQRTEPGRRDFVLRTCVPEEFDLELADELAGGTDIGEHLAALEASGLLTRSDQGDTTLYRYHPILREALLGELAARLAGEVDRLSVVTARWCHRRGAPMKAVRFAVAGGDLELASEVIVGNWTELLVQRGLYDVLSPLPVHRVARHPIIAMVLALAVNAHDARRLRAAEYFAMAVASAKLVGPRTAPAERATLATVESVALRLTGRPTQGVGPARRALGILAEASKESLGPLGQGIAQLRVQNAITLLRAGQLEDALEVLVPNLADLPTLPPLAQLTSVSTTAAARAISGHMPEARKHLEQARRGHWPVGMRDDYSGALYHLAEIVDRLERFDVVGAQRHLDLLAPHMETLEYRPLFAAAQAIVDLASGNASLGAQRLGRYRYDQNRERVSDGEQNLLVAVRALLLLAQGRASLAEKALGRLPRSPMATLVRAVKALLVGEYDDVVRVVARSSLRGDTSPRVAAGGHLLMAAASLRAHNDDAAVVGLEQMAAIMADCDVRMHLMLVPRRDLAALRAHANSQNLRLVRDVLADLECVPDVLPERAIRATVSKRESVVLHALVRTGNAAEIAEELVVSPNTVKTQIRSLYKKLGVNGRDEALFAAYQHGLLHADSDRP